MTEASDNPKGVLSPVVEVSAHMLLYRDHAISVLSRRHGSYLCRNLWHFYTACVGYVSKNRISSKER